MMNTGYSVKGQRWYKSLRTQPDHLLWRQVALAPLDAAIKVVVLVIAVIAVIGLLAGCTAVPPAQRIDLAHELISKANTASSSKWRSQIVVTDTFSLMSFGPQPGEFNDPDNHDNSDKPTGLLTVYIEGDGYAWVGGRYPSDDPTPKVPVALRLALAQPDGVAVYLARPCQFLAQQQPSVCVPSVWTRDRFAPVMVDALNQAIDLLKAQYGAKDLVLVGYSGGARMALELAAKRPDVTKIITVAGNLDPQAWVAAFGMRPLTPGTDNAALIRQIQAVPQWHYVGGQDPVVPQQLTEQFVGRFKNDEWIRIISREDNTHACCWAEQWPEIWREVSVRTPVATRHLGAQPES